MSSFMMSKVSGNAGKSKAVTKGQLSKILKQHDLATRELKYGGATVNGNATTTPAVTLISGIAQGDNVTDRDGFQINLMSFDINWTSGVGATTKFDNVRLVIVRDTMNQGSTPSSSDIMNANDPHAFLNIIPGLEKRFVVLYDGWFTHVNTASNQSIEKKIRIKMNSLPVTFTGTGSTQVGKNAIYAWICGGTAAADTPYLFQTQFRFFDS